MTPEKQQELNQHRILWDNVKDLIEINDNALSMDCYQII
jgi:hypothetical protein